MSETEHEAPPSHARRWALALALMGATLVSMLYVGALAAGNDPLADPRLLATGAGFAVPLMAILVCHELGHYVVARMRGVGASPPYFIPMPLLAFGTMGAVIELDEVRDRRTLLDVGAAGPIAGMIVALPVLAYGIATSPILPMSDMPEGVLIEGRSVLYGSLLWLLKGAIPAGHDIFLSGTAFAGWVGLLLTMMNLLPVAQLDGGHVAYALFGERWQRASRAVLAAMALIGLATMAVLGAASWTAGGRGEALAGAIAGGAHWLFWCGLVLLTARWSTGGLDHPPATGPSLDPTRRAIAIGLLVLFVLLFMPAWLRPA